MSDCAAPRCASTLSGSCASQSRATTSALSHCLLSVNRLSIVPNCCAGFPGMVGLLLTKPTITETSPDPANPQSRPACSPHPPPPDHQSHAAAIYAAPPPPDDPRPRRSDSAS